ncbi:speckle-type POZ protein [Caerostris extrusa]|uniref:Speckle-type POZ protein n=1 Tax=Caerostris extrusa TaxID=172846 RepID=A0AAV4NGT4_CAEEX|nr:speckle-type POZ protein [Caerostris extrusa]
MALENDKKAADNVEGFTFQWSIENISYSGTKKGEAIISPRFAIDNEEKLKVKNPTIWYLSLYPRGYENGSLVELCLERENSKSDPEVNQIDYELAWLSKDGSIITRVREINKTFLKGSSGSHSVVKREHVFSTKRSIYIPQDVLTVRCKIFQRNEKPTPRDHHFARSRIAIDKRSFPMFIEGFEDLEPDSPYDFEIRSADQDELLMTVDVLMTGGLCCEEIFHVQVFFMDPEITYLSIQGSLLGEPGNPVKCLQDECWYDGKNREEISFALWFTKKQIMSMSNFFIQDGVLPLCLDCVICTGISVEEVEKVSYDTSLLSLDAETVDVIPKISYLESSNILKENLKALHSSNFASDVALQTPSGSFPAHKSIISQSPVFKDLLDTKAIENGGTILKIDDIGDDIIILVLEFLYTSDVEDLNWENAWKLHKAAEKYEILALKKKCMSFLMSNVCLTNACEALNLSQLNKQEELKSFIQSFIFKHAKEIIVSEEWKRFMGANLNLAAETMHVMCKEWAFLEDLRVCDDFYASPKKMKRLELQTQMK